MTEDDRRLVQRKLRRLSGYLDELEIVATIAHQEFVSTPRHYEAERLIELMVTTAIEINIHLIRRLEIQTATTYRETFLILDKAAVIPSELATKLAESAGFRNKLVHNYDDIDLDRLYAGLADGIADYRAYAAAISQYVGI